MHIDQSTDSGKFNERMIIKAVEKKAKNQFEEGSSKIESASNEIFSINFIFSISWVILI